MDLLEADFVVILLDAEIGDTFPCQAKPFNSCVEFDVLCCIYCFDAILDVQQDVVEHVLLVECFHLCNDASMKSLKF